MKELLVKYARFANLAVYPLFYLVCLAVFATLTFPYSKLKEHIATSFNSQQRAIGGKRSCRSTR